jgi:heme exporter protein D
MEKVVHFEKRRTREWLVRFFIFLLATIVAVVGGALIVGVRIWEREAWEPLTLFWEDPEIVSEFWRETLSVLWEETPQQWVAVVLGGIVLLIVLIVGTRRRRKVIQRRIQKLAQYEKVRHNTKEGGI